MKGCLEKTGDIAKNTLSLADQTQQNKEVELFLGWRFWEGFYPAFSDPVLEQAG